MKFKYIVLLLLFSAAMMTSLWVNNIYLLFSFSVFCWAVLPFGRWWDKTTIALFIFSILYLLIQLINGNAVDSKFIQGAYLLAPVAFYRFGRYLYSYYTNDESRQKVLLCILVLYLSPLFIATFKDIALVGFINQTRQLLSDLSNNQGTLAATLYGLMASIGIAGVSVIFLRNQRLFLKSSFVLLGIFSLISVIHLVNRTGLVICAASLFMSFMASTKMNIKKIIPAVFVCVILYFLLDVFGVVSQDMKDAYNARENDSGSDSSSAGGRTELWMDAVNNLIIQPFGWELKSYAHNLWLDIARVSGLCAFIPFVYATIRLVKDSLKVIKYNKSHSGIILLTIVFAGMLNAAVEPTIDGSMLFFSILMLLWGMLKQVALESKSIHYQS